MRAYWVKELPKHQFQFDQLVMNRLEELIETGKCVITTDRSMRWVKFTWGWVIETCNFDTAKTTTIETLISYNSRSAVIVHRARFGPNYTETVQYSRDYVYPVSSIVWLSPCSE